MALSLVFASCVVSFATDNTMTNNTFNTNICKIGDLTYRIITEDEYCKSLAKKHNISLQEAKIMSDKLNEQALNNYSLTKNNGIYRYGIINTVVYNNFYYKDNKNMGIEVGFPCKIDAGPSSGAYVLGSEGEAYALEIGQSGHVYKAGVLTGKIETTNKARLFTRGNFEFSSSFSVSAGIPVGGCSKTVNGYYRTPVVSYEKYKYASGI